MKKFILIIPLLIISLFFCGLKFDEKIKVFCPEKGVYVAKLNSSALNIYPYYSSSLETIASVAKKTGAKVAINAGFFDPVNQKTISYVVENGTTIGNPLNNENLLNNETLKPILPQVLNRSEFRILKSKECKIRYDITKHNDSVEEGWIILHSIQAGPELFPNLNLEDEAFVAYCNGKVVRDSISALSLSARSAIGLKDNDIYIVAVSNDKKMTMRELSNFMKKLGVKKAMAFDGGSSTSLYVNLQNMKVNISSAKNNESRKVKSILLITEKF